MLKEKDFLGEEEAVEATDPNEVTLTWFEVQMAVNVGVSRQIECMKNGQKSFQIRGAGTWEPHIEGACGEMAFAKASGAYFSGSINTFKKERDVSSYEIRTAASHNFRLIVRPKDDDDHIFVLVTGKCPNYHVRGWIRGGEAKKDEYLKHPNNGGPPAYFIPVDALNPMSTLPAS